MAHFGVLTFSGMGHLHPMMALARELVARGHRVTFFLPSSREQMIRQCGLEFVAVDVDVPRRVVRGQDAQVRLRARAERIADEVDAYLNAYLRALRQANVDVLLVSEIALAGPTVAEALRVPYCLISTSIPHELGWGASRGVRHSLGRLARLRRDWLEVSVTRMRGPVLKRLDASRRQMGLVPWRLRQRELLHVTQVPEGFELPHVSAPGNLLYAGPLVDDAAREDVAFPWERLDGRPLVYASLGTMPRGDVRVFARMAEACCALDAQLVIALGGVRDVAAFAGLPGEPVVVGYAPQLALLRRADAVVTHAGPNTVFEALLCGVPMVAMPVALDQFAVAARVKWAGVGVVLAEGRRSVAEIRAALEEVLRDGRFRERALGLQVNAGVMRAADGIENAVEAKRSELERGS